MLKKNSVYCGNCAELLKQIDNDIVDLTVTSPPYDDLRSYEGYVFDFDTFKTIANELFRVTKEGGSVVWVVGDEVKDGSETGTSFRQALYFKEVGFRLHDTMIYAKNSSTFPASRDGNRYTQIFEYMFVFSKGKPKCKLLCDKRNKWAGFQSFDKKIPIVKETSPRVNIWGYVTSFDDNDSKHPAVFPLDLARDHIRTWTDVGDLILDPLSGSGTTLKAAKEENRNYIGIEISEKYCSDIRRRLNDSQQKDITNDI